MKYTYPVRIVEKDGDIEIHVRDFPQVGAAGSTIEEAREIAEDAILVMLEIFLEDGLKIPPASTAEDGEELISVSLA